MIYMIIFYYHINLLFLVTYNILYYR